MALASAAGNHENGMDGLSSVRTVLDFNFRSVNDLLRLVRLSMESISCWHVNNPRMPFLEWIPRKYNPISNSLYSWSTWSQIMQQWKMIGHLVWALGSICTETSLGFFFLYHFGGIQLVQKLLLVRKELKMNIALLNICSSRIAPHCLILCSLEKCSLPSILFLIAVNCVIFHRGWLMVEESIW